MLAAHGRAVDRQGGTYITAEDVGMGVSDLVAVSKHTRHVAGLPVGEGEVGGDPGPHTAYGIFLGVKAAVRRALRSEEHTSELQSLMRISYAVFCLTKKTHN